MDLCPACSAADSLGEICESGGIFDRFPLHYDGRTRACVQRLTFSLNSNKFNVHGQTFATREEFVVWAQVEVGFVKRVEGHGEAAQRHSSAGVGE